MLRFAFAHLLGAGQPLVARRVAARCSSSLGPKLPASFQAPELVNLDDYPPPSRKLCKGEHPARGLRARRSLPAQRTWRCTSCAAAARAGRT